MNEMLILGSLTFEQLDELKRKLDELHRMAGNEHISSYLDISVADCKEIIKKYEAQQMNVRNNMEYDSLQGHIEMMQGLIAYKLLPSSLLEYYNTKDRTLDEILTSLDLDNLNFVKARVDRILREGTAKKRIRIDFGKTTRKTDKFFRKHSIIFLDQVASMGYDQIHQISIKSTEKLTEQLQEHGLWWSDKPKPGNNE